MTELEKISSGIAALLGTEFGFYRENSGEEPGRGLSRCDRQFEGVTDDGECTFFRFLYKNTGYIGVIGGTGTQARAYAALLPAYIENRQEKEADLSKTEYLKRILFGECSSAGIYRYMTKFSVGKSACFALALSVPGQMEEVVSLISQYGGNSLDTVVALNRKNCVFVKFVGEEESEYQSPADYAEFLAQSLREELGLETTVGVGSVVKSLKDIPLSYSQAAGALRYAEVFSSRGNVHSYREYLLVRMLEDVPESKLMEYLGEMTDEGAKEIFEDADMLNTAEEFLQSSLNVSETSRKLYMHRNTLLYRLDKIEKATGLNIRQFPDAVSFRVLTVLYRLLGK
ncbi:MAG TPA: helix-turn-helix domain-containing protein [Candidatus Scatosoma pullistercoris]|uniref:Helix-turn-helix domain-containing protein n=1 Tax=Candidatus Scatosoma pullistercoris TaxID=2840934 RepID=A0A9D1SGV1_9FIRM|nr:helix-turn-helix domain-containing protein [Candidatus Scatosoma pullistercoris]